jgi:fluoride ion exporter CrcB/FEX
MMVYSLAVAAGGALGALSRYWLMLWVTALGATRFPWGTLLVNVLGSCAIGVLYVLISEKRVIGCLYKRLMSFINVRKEFAYSIFKLPATRGKLNVSTKETT